MSKIKTTKTITLPVMYNGFIVRPTSGGFDLIDPQTKRWAHFPTQRYAKWTASFVHNINERFAAHAPLKTLPNVVDASTDGALTRVAKQRLKRSHTAIPVDIDKL